MKGVLIGLCGAKGSGKTFIAENMRDHHGATILRFADTLKDMMRVMGFTEAHLTGDQKETPSEVLKGKTPRYAMQTLGTEWGRQMLHDTVWVDILVAKSKQVQGMVVVDDVRFPNEIEAIHNNGGIVVWVDRESIYEEGDIHPSETSIQADHCDVIMDNTGAIADVCINLEGWARLQARQRAYPPLQQQA